MALVLWGSRMTKHPTSFLDTSIFIEVFKEPNMRIGQKKLLNLTNSSRREASYYTILELNRQLLALAIELYDEVLIQRDPNRAKIKLSNKWGRSAKYFLIIDSLLMSESSSVIHNNYRVYAALLESFIVAMQERIWTLVHAYVGDFKKHILVMNRVNSADDFEQHKAIIKSLTIDYESIWTDHAKELKAALVYFKSLPKPLAADREVMDLIEQILTEPKKANRKHFGDLVISLNAPNNARMLAHDKIFTTLGPSLDKKAEYVIL